MLLTLEGASHVQPALGVECLHPLKALVGQRVFGIALGYEDLNHHEHLRHDPAMAVLAIKRVARRSDCAPVAARAR